jgi:sulfhydrogenase subunit delta
MSKEKAKIGIYGFTGCAGDQLSIIDCEQEIVAFFTEADIESFIMAKSDNREDKLDAALVEGSVTTEREKEELLEIRGRSGLLVAIGNCACVGGPQAAFLDPKEWARKHGEVYGKVKWTHTTPLQSKPLDAYVKVDFYLPGCPISREQLLPTFTRLLGLTPPDLYKFAVCMECKWKENDCLLNKDIPCLGPLTAAGCGAVCPSHNLPCVGCWGPAVEPNREAMMSLLKSKGFGVEFIRDRMAMFSGTRIAQFTEKLKEVTK